MQNIFKPSLNWLFVFLPLTIWFRYFGNDGHPSDNIHTIIFVTACLTIIPLAGWLGRATEHLAERTSEGLGGLLNATFGNAAELIIAIVALQKGLYEVVKASLTGSIIGNILLVLGLSCLCGGTKHKVQEFNEIGARNQATMLLLAAVALVVPAVFHYLVGPNAVATERSLSLEISIVLLLTYALSLFFSLHTHKQLFSNSPVPTEDIPVGGTSEDEHIPWSIYKSCTVLVVATVAIAWISEILVGSVEHAATSFGMSNVFVGVIVVAIVGNAAEHSSAILMALKNRMDLSLGIAIGSSIQVALFVAPTLVILSYFIAPQPMDLVFTPAEVMAVVVSVLVVEQVAGDGKSNWFEGAQLLSLYSILAMVFYFLP